MRALPLGATLHAFLVATCVAAVPAAATRGIEEVLACAAVSGDAARLACYDTRNPPHNAPAASPPPAAAGLQPPASSKGQAGGVPPTSSRAPASSGAVAPASAEFGLSESAVRRKQEQEGKVASRQEKLIAKVSAVSSLPHGEVVLELDNGQTWAQIEARAGTIIKAGEGVTITQRALGGFMLSTDSGIATRVRRLK